MPRSFDWMAKPYATLERMLFGQAFQRIRTAFVPALDERRAVLVLGEGDGRFAAALLARNPTVQVTLVDASAQMLCRARQRTTRWRERVHYVHSDAVAWVEQLPATTHFDAVVTTFFLDCLTEPELTRLFAAISPRIVPNGLWLWCDLVVPKSPWRRVLGQGLLQALYFVFRLTTNITARSLVDPSLHFSLHGWVSRTSRSGFSKILQARVMVRN